MGSRVSESGPPEEPGSSSQVLGDAATRRLYVHRGDDLPELLLGPTTSSPLHANIDFLRSLCLPLVGQRPTQRRRRERPISQRRPPVHASTPSDGRLLRPSHHAPRARFEHSQPPSSSPVRRGWTPAADAAAAQAAG